MESIFEQKIEHPYYPELQVIFKAYCEHLNLKEHFDDEETIKWIENQLNKGNFAAWFSAEVGVSLKTYPQIKGISYLGGCSYKSFDDFVYEEIETLIEAATNDLLSELPKIIESSSTILKKHLERN